ncbi:MAG: DUF1573 domain-containing protein [Bacteroidia bacterium]
MKNLSAFTLLMLVSLFSIESALAQPKVKENTAVGKSIEFDTQSYDFGHVEAGNYPGYRFVFVNNSSKRVSVTGFGRVCNLTVPAYSQEPIEPGESGFVKIVLNPRDLNGSIRKNFQIIFTYSDDGQQMRTGKNLIVEGNIVPEQI